MWEVNPAVCTLSIASLPSYQADWSSKPTVVYEFMKIVLAIFGQIDLSMDENFNVKKIV
jgi:hypothetical protein